MKKGKLFLFVICDFLFVICDFLFGIVIFYLVPIAVPINRKIKNDKWKMTNGKLGKMKNEK
jgi:uncharacterized membrane protein YesL